MAKWGRFMYHHRVSSFRVLDSSLHLNDSYAPYDHFITRKGIMTTACNYLGLGHSKFQLIVIGGVWFLRSIRVVLSIVGIMLLFMDCGNRGL